MSKQQKKELKRFIAFLIVVFIFGFFLKQLQSGNNITYMGYRKNYDGSLVKVAEAVGITATPTPELGAIADSGEEFKDKFQELAFKIFGEKNYKIAYAIARAESSLNPDNCHIDEKEYSCGLMQINLRAHGDKVPGDTFEEKVEWLKDPENNFTMARVIKANSKSWNPWTMYTNGMYEQYLD